jgi:VanZ family protein
MMAYVPAVVWGGVLVYIGGRVGLTNPRPDLPIDKVAHLITYGLLGVLAGLGWRWARRWPAPLWPMLFAFAVGIIDELHQSTVPGREAGFFDLITNGVGIVLGFIAVARLHARTILPE